MRIVSVLVADGQNVRGLGTTVFLDGHESGVVEVIGQAVDADETLSLCVEHGPDVVVLDPAIEQHGGSALWLCLALKLHGFKAPKLVLFTGAEEVPGGDVWDFCEKPPARRVSLKPAKS